MRNVRPNNMLNTDRTKACAFVFGLHSCSAGRLA
jgi:hypothetical protein